MVARRKPPPLYRAKRPIDIPTHAYPHLASLLSEAFPYIEAEVKRRTTPLVARQHYPSIVEWAQDRFYVPATKKPIYLYPHQQAILKLALNRRPDGDLPYQTFVYSTIKQSGKSTIAGVIARWYAEEQASRAEIYCIGNDRDQAMMRSFREIRYSLELSPGYDPQRDRLPGEWELLRTIMRCLTTGTEVRALAVDAKGEAGGKPAIQVWTELWGFEQEDALRFWDELTPIPTIPDSLRIVETYAGYDGESTLLQGLYDLGKAGRHLSAGELAQRTGTELGVFAEATHPDDPVPIYEVPNASMLMYWDEGLAARRMPWQLGERGDRYYDTQKETLLAQAYIRLHENLWTSSESAFVRAEHWDSCYAADIPPLELGDRTPVVLGVDAATSGDCFAIVMVSRHPDPARRLTDVAVRNVRVWNPKESGGLVDYDECERFIRYTCQGGCRGSLAGGVYTFHPRSDLKPDTCEACASGDMVPGYNVVQVAYDPYQLEQMMQRLTRDQVVWCEPFIQGGERLKADRSLYDLIMTRRLAHNGDPLLRTHVLSAGAKVQKDQDSTMRLVKLNATKKIDATVALSMASARSLYLVL